MFEIYVKSKYKQKLLDKLSGDLITKYRDKSLGACNWLQLSVNVLVVQYVDFCFDSRLKRQVGQKWKVFSQTGGSFEFMKGHEPNPVRSDYILSDLKTSQFRRPSTLVSLIVQFYTGQSTLDLTLC